MATTQGIVQQLRRRNGAPGAPALRSGQFFSNEGEGKVYIGTGDDGNGNATAPTAVGGQGFVMALLSSSAILGAILAALPTSPPATAGLAWLDNGVLRVS